MKYAELHGNMQKCGTKSLHGNIMINNLTIKSDLETLAKEYAQTVDSLKGAGVTLDDLKSKGIFAPLQSNL